MQSRKNLDKIIANSIAILRNTDIFYRNYYASAFGYYIGSYFNSYQPDSLEPLNNAKTPIDFLNRLMSIERKIYARINRLLGQVGVGHAVDQQENILKEIESLIDALSKIEIVLCENLDEFIDHNEILSLMKNEIVINIPKYLYEDIANCNLGRISEKEIEVSHRNEVAFADLMKKSILISLARIYQEEVGVKFVNKLYAAMKANNCTIQLVTKYAMKGSSLSIDAAPNGIGGSVSPLFINTSDSVYDLRVALKQIKKIKPNSSLFVAPFWDKNQSEKLYMQRYGVYFAKIESVFEAMEQLCRGSFYFDHDKNICYGPNYIGVIHELIHALHNVKGSHRGGCDSLLTYDQRLLWTSAEEYWAIEGGKTNENTFNRIANLPDRSGHGGFYDLRTYLDENKIVSRMKP